MALPPKRSSTPWFLHRLHRPLNSTWHHHTKAFTTAQKDDLKIWLDILSIAKQGVSSNLLTYHRPDIICWSDASLTGLGSYSSSGLAWRWEIPMTYWGYLTLNSLEYAASIITIQLCLHHLLDSFPFPASYPSWIAPVPSDGSIRLPPTNPPIVSKPI